MTNDVKKGDLFAFYGTLRRSTRPGITFAGMCSLAGKMFNVGSFPALVKTNEAKLAVGELYEVEDPIVVESLDSYEGYHPSDPDRSLYVRHKVPVETPDGTKEAWVYFFNQPYENLPEITSGDWMQR